MSCTSTFKRQRASALRTKVHGNGDEVSLKYHRSDHFKAERAIAMSHQLSQQNLAVVARDRVEIVADGLDICFSVHIMS